MKLVDILDIMFSSPLWLYVKLAQKQIDYEIWQGLFFIIKENRNTTFLRFFVCQYFHENSTIEESLTWLLNTSEFLTYEKKIPGF